MLENASHSVQYSTKLYLLKQYPFLRQKLMLLSCPLGPRPQVQARAQRVAPGDQGLLAVLLSVLRGAGVDAVHHAALHVPADGGGGGHLQPRPVHEGAASHAGN